jgi:hypothetical protein
MNEQENTNWLTKELEEINSKGTFTGERLPALKLESGKITTFKVVDLDKPFGEWKDDNGIKAIINVEHKGEKKTLWLNKRNPLYKEVVQKLRTGVTEFKVSTTGVQKETRYTLVEED